MDTSRTSAQFHARWQGLHTLLPAIPIDPSPLLARYLEPCRHYHSVTHILDCLAYYRVVLKHERGDPSPALLAAIFFHDAVYDPRAANNEHQSALLARQDLASVPAQTIADITRLIEITDHRHSPTRPDEQLILDIDLAILGQSPAIFDAYESAIRREYKHVPDGAFRQGRSRILESFLARPHLYHTSFFKQYEAPARVNLSRSLAQLSR